MSLSLFCRNVDLKEDLVITRSVGYECFQIVTKTSIYLNQKLFFNTEYSFLILESDDNDDDESGGDFLAMMMTLLMMMMTMRVGWCGVNSDKNDDGNDYDDNKNAAQ